MQQNLCAILLIDNSYLTYIKGFSSIADTYNFVIKPFSSIPNGIDYLKANKEDIGAVLLDLGSLNFNGDNTLHFIKELNPLLPVLILSGSKKEDIELAVDCMKDGAFNYVIRKEINIESLFKMLRVAVKQYEVNNKSERYVSLKEEFRNKITLYEKMIYTSEMILKNILNDKLMFPPTYEGRVKTFKSFYNKLLLKEQKEGFIEYPFKRIKDLAGLRVIFFNAQDLQTAVELVQNSKDFIDANPLNASLTPDDKSKTCGYRAVHFDVKLNAERRLQLPEYQDLSDIPCEVQFKTVFAHSWSEIHHTLSYKEIDNLNLTEKDHEQLNFDFIESAKNLEEIEKKITDLCIKYYPQSTNSLTKTN